MVRKEGERMAIIYKTCSLCKQKKVRGLFNKHHSYADGFNTKCKKCSRVKNGSKQYRDIVFARKQVKRWGHAKI